MKRIILICSIAMCLLAFKSNDIEQVQEVNITKLENAVLASGSLYRLNNYPSKYITPRPVDIWLPENYSCEKKYNVLYMHDGQNLFDATTTWNKQEWKVDDWITTLTKENKINDVIVVGIHNIPNIRWQDLFPEKAFDYMPTKVKDSLFKAAEATNFNVDFKGNEYLKFLVEELKPIIDKQYSVYTDRKHTFVAGSSMGGLMSMYAISEYPNVFSGAACLSTHWVGGQPMTDNPFPDAIFKYVEARLPEANTHKLYFDYGNKTLDQHYPKFAPRLDAILKAKGYSGKDSKNLFFEGTNHSENAWNKRLDIPLTFLLRAN